MGIWIAMGAAGRRDPNGQTDHPLTRVDTLGAGGRLCVDNAQRLCAWGTRTFPCAPDVTDAACWRGCPLLLSGESDSITLHAPDGMPLWTAPAGFAPRQLCLLPGGRCAAVACGLAGEVRLLRLPALTLLHACPVPGAACCLCWHQGALYAACVAGEGEIRGLLCRVPFHAPAEVLAAVPGLPGALLSLPSGALLLGATERIYRFEGQPLRLTTVQAGFGLPRRMLVIQERLLVADPVQEALFTLSPALRAKPAALLRGSVMDVCPA